MQPHRNSNYIPTVIDAKYLKDYKIEMEFDNGERRIADFSKWLHGEVFEPLKDVNYFKKFFVDGWTIAWPNGADIAPETLYDEGERIESIDCANGAESLK